MPRPKRNTQGALNFQPSNLKLTNQYFAKYEAIDRILRQNPRIVDLVHQDLKEVKDAREGVDDQGAEYRYPSDTVLRVILAQDIEGESLRGIVIRVDDSAFLRCFTRIDHGPMMSHTTLCRLRNAIRPETWRKVNRVLAVHAVSEGQITGELLRLDTTAVETNVHFPTDSSLLWDVARTLGRLIGEARELAPTAVGKRRLHLRRIKRVAARISRNAAKRGRKAASLKPLYERLLGQVEAILDWATELVSALSRGGRAGRSLLDEAQIQVIAEELIHHTVLGRRVAEQARRRVLDGEIVPNNEKLFSIFEEHTELLKRGKAGKDVEFGHMIQIQQVPAKFITDYEVFEKRPKEGELLRPALNSHRRLFGYDPDCITADKGYYESMDALRKLEQRVPLVSIAKMGKRTAQETEREFDPVFRHAQRFRAGVEGTISFLKRVLGLVRILRKGWEHFVAAVGETIFAHNLLILARC